MKILAVDFDGTITRHSRYPKIGEPNTEFIEWLKKEKGWGKTHPLDLQGRKSAR